MHKYTMITECGFGNKRKSDVNLIEKCTEILFSF